eukprot:TRINITY_DN17938_c0_g1_i1.p1 TRINITY_DN17938_c0_g1~~TRINITY_DN17938_c0_g1_i1.p1  ORF type:complete len:435 (-),score=38.89 TRINITY_DN17938_c0_g1_i1:490-1794(-)
MLLIEDLNGSWVASRGETIVIFGDAILINGIPAQGGFRFNGENIIGFTVYEVKGVKRGALANVEEVVWQSKYSQDDEQSWTRVDQEEVQRRNARTQKTMNQTAAIAGGSAFAYLSDAEQVIKLNSLIKEWSIGSLVQVRSCDICPDATNRAHTGLAVEHVHYIATCIRSEGFKDRISGHPDAHDVPVLVRERSTSKLGRQAMEKWHQAVKDQPPFPPYLLDGKDEIFCSLGSGHFSQALNLFRIGGRSLWSQERYVVKEPALQRALDDGISSIVLSPDIPVEERAWIAEMLNKTHGRKMRVGEDGRVIIEDGEAAQASQFVALSKVLDATELGLLVRVKMGVAEVDVTECAPDGDWHQLQPRTNGCADSTARAATTDFQATIGSRVMVLATRRIGEVILHDPDDTDLTVCSFEQGAGCNRTWLACPCQDGCCRG